MTEFKDMLVYLRKREKMSQAELARRVSVAPTTIASYEQGKRHPSFEIEEAIADVFNVDLDTLRGTPIKNQTSDVLFDDNSIKMMEMFTPLDDLHKKMALEYLKFLSSQGNQSDDSQKDA